jgi:hypothetical protein
MEPELTQRCSFCGETHPISEMMQGEITFLNGRYIGNKYKKFVDTQKNWYCKNKSCFSHDQMAHEG